MYVAGKDEGSESGTGAGHSSPTLIWQQLLAHVFWVSTAQEQVTWHWQSQQWGNKHSSTRSNFHPQQFLGPCNCPLQLQPATNRAKQEKPTEAAVGSDSHAERGNRAAEMRAKEREKE